MHGAIVSLAVVGSSPFIRIRLTNPMFCRLHRLFRWLFTDYKKFGRIVEGDKIILYHNDRFLKENLRQGLLREVDIRQVLRNTILQDNMDGIDKIYLEHHGDISLIKK